MASGCRSVAVDTVWRIVRESGQWPPMGDPVTVWAETVLGFWGSSAPAVPGPTMATYDPTIPLTVTLPEGRWSAIRAAVLCLACDERIKGNHKESAHYLRAFNDLKAAMGD